MLILLLGFISIKYSLALYVFHLITVPFFSLEFGPIKFTYFLLSIILLAEFGYYMFKKGKKISFREVRPFSFLFLILLLLTLFQDKIPISTQLNYWRIEFVQTWVVAFLIFNVCKSDPSAALIIKWGFILGVIVACIYGIVLLFFPPGFNPYGLLVAEMNGAEYNEAYADDAGRAIARIFSTFSHPLQFCFCLTLSLFAFLRFYKNKYKYFYICLIVLVVINLFYCGVRTGFVAVLVPIAYILYRRHDTSFIKYVPLVLIGFYFLFSTNEALQDLVVSLIDENKTDTKGSNIDMRLSQLGACFELTRGNELFGNGFRWTTYYTTTYGPHPVAYAFESLIFTIYCNSGIIGFFIWGAFFIQLFRNTRRFLEKEDDRIWLDSLQLMYMVFTLLTGEYFLMQWLSIVYAILACNMRIDNVGNERGN